MSSEIGALLIGIDEYEAVEGAGYYPNLRGAVNDARAVELHLRERVGVPAERITVLVSPSPDAAARPTYANIVAALRRVLDDPPGELYLHYSGHGLRTGSRHQRLKGRGTSDESLAPSDAARPESRSLVDVELIYFLSELAARGARATVVIDACHSGGMTRADAVARGLPEEKLIRAAPSLLAGDDALEAAWRKLGRRWNLPGCVVLTACRPDQSALENICDGRRHGVFTHRLLQAWRAAEKSARYRDLHQRVVAHVHGLYPSQTPQIDGDLDRVVLGHERFEVLPTISVLASTNPSVRLGAGAALGVGAGDRFVISAAPGGEPVLVEVDFVDGISAYGTPIDPPRAKVAPGSQATRVEVALPSRRRVRLLPREGAEAPEAFAAVAHALGGSGLVAPAEDSAPVDFQVRHSDADTLDICDAAGERLRRQPPLPAGASDAAKRVVARLEHLARYHNVLALTNHARMSMLQQTLRVSAHLAPAAFSVGDEATMALDDPLAPGYALADGDIVILRISHQSAKPVKIAVLNLQPAWSIELVHRPAADVSNAGHELRVPLQVSLAEGDLRATEILKVFATVGDADFDWITLPPLDHPPPAVARAIGNLHDALLAATGRPQPLARGAADHAARDNWATAEIELMVERG